MLQCTSAPTACRDGDSCADLDAGEVVPLVVVETRVVAAGNTLGLDHTHQVSRKAIWSNFDNLHAIRGRII